MEVNPKDKKAKGNMKLAKFTYARRVIIQLIENEIGELVKFINTIIFASFVLR